MERGTHYGAAHALEVEWGNLRTAIAEAKMGVTRVLEVYGRNANDIDPIAEEFLQDLADIEALAKWAEEQGESKMTLEVNW